MPIAPDLAGSALDGRYELHAVIGEGTFGRVYRGLDRRLRRPVAIKVIKPWWGEDPDWAERFEREAQLLARVSDPGIVQIFDVGQSDEGLYYVAELIDGESLAARLRRGPLEPAGAMEIAEQLCRALAHTHACDVIHRDIKPANVLLTPTGRVKLGDFSVARLGEASTEGQATIAGTPKYMAPEQARGETATAATDIYSVGVVLYEMLAGVAPFAGGTPVELALRHLQEPPPPLPGHVPPALRRVVMRALAKRPEQRYPSAAAMAAALAGAPAPDGRPAPAPGGPGAARRPRSTPPRPRATPGSPDPTRVAPELGPRRNANPAARRRAAALIAGVVLLIAAMLGAALLLGRTAHVRVPALRGTPRTAALAALAKARLHARIRERYATVAQGTVIGQSPAPGRTVDQGTTVALVVSAGPPPVRLPPLTGDTTAAASAALAHLGLQVATTQVVAPGVAAGTVTGQTPGAGHAVAAHSTVHLSVAEAPRWRTVTALTGTSADSTGTFRIRGDEWRVVYRMSYVGTCTFIFFCDGPTAHVSNASTGTSSDFDLSHGSNETRTFSTGPGIYRLDVTPGSDTAQWSITIQDRY